MIQFTINPRWRCIWRNKSDSCRSARIANRWTRKSL